MLLGITDGSVKYNIGTIILIDGQKISVRETIDYLAHYAGGVHNHQANTPHTIALERFSKEFNPRIGAPIALRIVRPIIQIVVDGTYPLYKAITDEPAPG
jgi:hypothetical protein